MKLTKLLPIATIASIMTIVTPLVTSCGGVSYTLDLKKINEYKMVEQVEGSMKESEATAKYFEAISKNPKIYADDIFWVNIKQGQQEIPDGITATITIKNIKIDKNKQTISACCVDKQYGEYEEGGHKQKVDFGYTYQIKNIPFEMSIYVESNNSTFWCFDPKYGEDITKWAADDKWTASAESHYYAWTDGEKVVDETNKKTTYNSKSEGDDAIMQIYSIVQDFAFLESHYFGKVIPE